MSNKVRLLVRRAAAKIVGEYPPPVVDHVQDLIMELKQAAWLGPDGSEWAAFAASIRETLRREGANHFLRLPPIAKTLHSRQRSHTGRYLEYVFGSKRFSRVIQMALTESPIGHPLVNPHYPLSSPLLIQHGYHLIRLLESTDFDLAKLRFVAEFGGGYGGFFRLLRNLDYRQKYLICDLPIMCALQKFYVRNLFPEGADCQPPTNLQWLSSDDYSPLASAAAEQDPSVFVATWSLSETPLEIRRKVETILPAFTHILCAYQRTFGSYDNVQYFTGLQKSLPDHTWQHFECPVYRNNFYLIGQSTRGRRS